MNTLKIKTKYLLKNSPFIFTLIKVLWRFINLSYLILLIRYTLHKIRIIKCLIFKKKITRDYFLGASTDKRRVKDLKILLDQQIARYQKSKDKEKFTLIEVGVFLGQTTEVLGKLLKKKLKKLKKIYINFDSTISLEELVFHPGVTFSLNDLGIKVNKSKNGIWSIV